jgi:hypothetical protein
MKTIIYLFVGVVFFSCKNTYPLTMALHKDKTAIKSLFKNDNSNDISRIKMYECSLKQVRNFEGNIGELIIVNNKNKQYNSKNHPYKGASFKLYFLLDTISYEAVFWSVKLNADGKIIRVNKPVFGYYGADEFIGSHKMDYHKKDMAFVKKNIKTPLYIAFNDSRKSKNKNIIYIESISFEKHKLSGNKPFIFEPLSIYNEERFLEFELIK